MRRLKEKLLRVIKSKEANAVATVGITGVSGANPLAGIFLTAIHEIAELADEARVDAVIKGLSVGIDQEKQINQLYNYVEKSDECAFYVANTLRKALLSDSPVACTIMGRILACHVNEDTVYTQEDKIVFNALENATDSDIKQFRNVMKNYSATNDKGNTVFHIPNEVINQSDFRISLDWCVFNRLFEGVPGISWAVTGQNYDDSYSPTPAACKLLDYIESVRQVLNY